MLTTVLAPLALAVTALFATPTAAAPAYVPDSGTGTILGTPAPGADLRVAFEGTFGPGETVSITITCPGANSMVVEDTADGSGSTDTAFTVPDGATGTCSITAVGVSSGSAGVAAFTVVTPDAPTSEPSDPDDGLAVTGTSPVAIVWLGGGLLVMGAVAFWILAQRGSTQRGSIHSRSTHRR